MSPIQTARSETLKRLYERKRAQLAKAQQHGNLMQRMIIEAELQALAAQLPPAAAPH